MSDGLALLGRAFALQQAGRLAEAEAAYAKVLGATPDDLTALVNAGAVAHARGDLPLAITRFERVAQLAPNNAIARNNLGLALIHAGRDADALAAIDRALAVNRNFAPAHNNRGLALLRLGRRAEAIASFERALQLQPGNAEAAMNLAERRNEDGDSARSMPLFDRVLAQFPDHVQAQTGRAFAQALAGDVDGASAALEGITQVAPGHAAAWQTLGAVRNWAWQHEAAETAFRRALELEPASHGAAFGVASTLLARGNFGDGWQFFERRADPLRESGAPLARIPPWEGEPFDGTLVVHGEQGFGDMIQFARFLAVARERARRIVLLVDGYRAPLATLLATLPELAAVCTDAADLPKDAAMRRVSMLSLPYRLGIGADAPAPARYLAPPAAHAEAWRMRMAAFPAPRVGLAWSVLARDAHGFVTRHKSVPPSVLAPLLAHDDTTFVTLQPGSAGDPAAFGSLASRVTDLRPAIQDFADTAALIDTLDLVLSADTAVAHLAGALGKPVWLLDRRNACWRWRSKVNWYPGLRIFRQRQLFDWTPVADEVATSFAAWRAQL